MNNNRTFTGVFYGVTAVLVILLGGLILNGSFKVEIPPNYTKAHIDAAKQSLKQKQDISVVHKGFTIEAKYTQHEDYEEAIATSEHGSESVRDYNKSKLLGRYVGRKSKPFTKGLIEGLRNK